MKKIRMFVDARGGSLAEASRIASLILILTLFTATPSMAQGNFVQAFLSRYRPSSATPATTAAPAQDIQLLLREGALQLTVGDMVRLMLESNLDVRVNRLSPLESQYVIQSLFGRFEPSLRLGATVTRNTQPSRSQLDGASAPSILNHAYSIGYSQSFAAGTNFGVDFRVNRNSSNSVFSSFNPSYSGTLTYSFSQPLLRNAGRNINLHTIRVAQNNKNLSELQFEAQLADIVTQGELLYWNLVLAQEDIKVRQRSLELAQKTLRDNQRMVEIGTLAPIEVVQAEAEVASREEQLVTTTYNSDQLQDQMKRVITQLGDPALVLAKLNPVEQIRRPGPGDLMPIQEAISYALENRPDMRQLELLSKNDEMSVAFSKNQLLPSFDVFGSYTQSGLGGVETLRSGLGENAIVGVKQGGLWNAFNQVFGYDFTGYAVGFSVTIPLSNKAAQAEYSRVSTQKQLNEARRTALAQSIAVQVRNAHSQVEMNRVRIQAAEKNLELAQRQLAAEQTKNQRGVSSIRFVLEEQRRVTLAESTAIQALINYTSALVRYEQAIGRTLRRNNVEIQKQLVIAE